MFSGKLLCTYIHQLLNNLSLQTLHANRLENICIEINKIKHGLNPKYMNDLITERPSQYQYSKPFLDLLIPKSNQISFGYKIIRTLPPTIWNTLSAEIQALTKLDEWKTNKTSIPWTPGSWIYLSNMKIIVGQKRFLNKNL